MTILDPVGGATARGRGGGGSNERREKKKATGWDQFFSIFSINIYHFLIAVSIKWLYLFSLTSFIRKAVDSFTVSSGLYWDAMTGAI